MLKLVYKLEGNETNVYIKKFKFKRKVESKIALMLQENEINLKLSLLNIE